MAESSPDDAAVQEISDWLIEQGLGEARVELMFIGLCERLVAAGLPLDRGHVAGRALHPLIESWTYTWRPKDGLEAASIGRGQGNTEEWQASPLRALIDSGRSELYFDLERGEEWVEFPLLVELREKGGTAYLCFITPFGNREKAMQREDGVLTSWLTHRPGGFSDANIAALRRLQPRLGIVAKMIKREWTAANVAAAYLGADAGRRVLSGQIQRGDGEGIRAVLWFSDLRRSTPLADSLPTDQFLELLNRYFECLAGAVLDNDGEVLRFIGDAVLAVFPTADGKGAAAEKALAAARDAEARMDAVNADRAAAGEEALDYGLGLHIGEVLYGNIGVPQRVEFSVIGRAANEVARLDDLAKALQERVVVSERFAKALPIQWRPLGRHSLRGVEEEIAVFAPPGHV